VASECSQDDAARLVRERTSLQVQDELARILRSESFRHSEQLRVLLSYLTQRSIEGQAGELKEYSVGIDALGKRDGYSPRQDATVRIQTGRLRLKLEEYFRTEGAADPIVFGFPKGGFKIVFHDRVEPPSSEPASAGSPALWNRDVHVLRRISLGLAVALIASIAAAIYAFATRPAPAANLVSSIWSQDLATIWRPFVESGRPLTVSLGTPLFVSLDGISVRDWTMNQWQKDRLTPALERIRQALHATDVRPSYGYNGFGETAGALGIFRLFVSRGKDVSFRRANALSWEDLKERDMVLLGSPKSIVHLKNLRDLRTKLAFDIEEDRIVNHHPMAGEAGVYPKAQQSASATYDTYALVTRLPGLDGTGNIMILGSPDTEGTLAACEYVTNPAHAGQLLRELAYRGRGPLPDAYQVLLKVTVRTDVPLAIAGVAHRILQPEAQPVQTR
jgi:hypothetical protein